MFFIEYSLTHLANQKIFLNNANENNNVNNNLNKNDKGKAIDKGTIIIDVVVLSVVPSQVTIQF